jgi:methionyl-tRNA formyltransferase
MHFTLNGQGIKILGAQPLDLQGKPGEFLDSEFTVACGAGALRLLRIQPAGKKPMGGADFLRGLAQKPTFVDGF